MNVLEAPGPAAVTKAAADQILRFRQSERQLHWAVALPFMGCLATALVLVTVYNPAPGRPLRWLFSWAHRASGLCLVFFPAFTAVRHRRDLAVYLRNVREAWTWALDDFRWLLLMAPATFDKRISLPHQGKFNAAEKINFMLLTATYPIYVVTGLLIWLPGAAYLSWLVHVLMAFCAVPLIGGHVFMATVNPDTRVGLSGMISGWVDREWARHHYRRWYDEHFSSTEPKQRVETRAPQRAPAPSPSPAVVVRLAGAATSTATLAAPVEPQVEPSPDDDTVAA